eukprot:GHVQ01003300.1.p1 GENE.GHVQ01003300.1~~GHVQ01003300.1.p1  ORF type:complete len:406 (-),score=37.32 GHVQ01003300.1:935-2152(-)
MEPVNRHWEYHLYTTLSLVLSCIILLCLFGFHHVSAHQPLLVVMFRSVTRAQKRLFCFEIDLTGSKEGKRVQSCLRGLLRTVVVLVLCFLWQSCVLRYRVFNLNHTVDIRELVAQCQIFETDCFAASSPMHFFLFWHTPTQICSSATVSAIVGPPSINLFDVGGVNGYVARPNEIDVRGMGTTTGSGGVDIAYDVSQDVLDVNPFVICMRWVPPDTLLWTTQLAIAVALCHMVVTLSEVMVWIVLETRHHRTCSIGVLVVSVLLFAGWVGSMFVDEFFVFYGSWLGFAQLLSVPIILLICRQISTDLRCIRHAKIHRWKANANRPIDQLDSSQNLTSPGQSLLGGQMMPRDCGSLDYAISSRHHADHTTVLNALYSRVSEALLTHRYRAGNCDRQRQWMSSAHVP